MLRPEEQFVDGFTVFLNRLNTFSETIAKFLKTLNTNLRKVNNFVKTPEILLKTKCSTISKHSYQMNISYFQQNTTYVFMFCVHEAMLHITNA